MGCQARQGYHKEVKKETYITFKILSPLLRGFFVILCAMGYLKKDFEKFAICHGVAIFATAICLLVACGEESTSEATRLDSEDNTYAGVDDLPECTAKKAGDLANVSGSYYACVSKEWLEVEDVVVDVCNIPACNKKFEKKWVFSKEGKKAYQCKSGSWKDADGKGFTESEYIGCFLNAIIQDSVDVLDDLKSCTTRKEGRLAAVDEDLVVCVSKKWAELSGYVVSEADLPECEKNGSFVYVLGKMAAYQCKDGLWYRDGEAVNQSSADVPKSSSSQVAEKTVPSSSSEARADISSSSKLASSASNVEEDKIKVRGVCIASEKDVEKGTEVTYSFYNLGGTVISYSWNFDESASIAMSDSASPKVSYNKGGTHRAKLVLNKGSESESDEIVCSGVHVPGTEITGCECNANESALTIRGGRSENAAWVVSGCTGGEPFTYDWEDGVVADGASASKVVTEVGSVSPSVTVFNDDEESLTVTCPAVSVSRSLSATCDFTVYYGNSGHLQISDVTNPPAGQEQLAFTLVGSEESEPKTVPIEGSCWDSNCSFWGTFMTMNYVSPRYDVIFDGDTICTYIAVTDCSCEEVELVSGSKELTESNPVQYRWTVSGCQDHGAGALTYSWIGDNYEADEEDPKIAVGSFTERGRYYARVMVTNPLGYSMTATCARASVTEAPYVEKDLEYGDVLPAGSYAIYSHEGGRSWLTWADEGEEIPDDLRDWFEQGLDTISTVQKLCGDSITYQAYTISVSYPVLLTIPEGKSLALRECVLKGDDDE